RSVSLRRTTNTSDDRGPRASSTLAAAVMSLTVRGTPGEGLRLRLLRLAGGLALEALLDGFQQAFHGERLADVVDDAEVFRVRLVTAALVGGNHDDRRRVGLAAEVLQHRVAAHARHHHVEDHEVGPLVVDLLLALLAVARLDDAVALPLEH